MRIGDMSDHSVSSSVNLIVSVSKQFFFLTSTLTLSESEALLVEAKRSFKLISFQLDNYVDQLEQVSH